MGAVALCLGGQTVSAVAQNTAVMADATETVTLEAALREARVANARLPLPALDLTIATEREQEARAERWLKVAVEGDFIYAPYPGYSPAITNLGEARLQAVVRQPIYAGGALDAAVSRAGAGAEAARARFRIAEKDLELEVRSRYAELLQTDAEIGIRRSGAAELDRYATSLRSRQAAGQGVAADILKTDVRRSLEEAALSETEQHREEARIALNDLMGRDPAGPLRLAELPAPAPPGAEADDAWLNAPEVAAAAAMVRSAEADTTIAAAEQRPRLTFAADAGFLVDNTMHLNADFWDRFWRNKGYSLSLLLVWPIWDPGAAKARREEAALGLQQARLQVEIERRDARLAWAKARSALAHLYRQVEILSRTVPVAGDSFLEAESRYRGGTASTLEVLDAHAAALNASVRLSEVVARYRVAEALARRWSTP